MGYEAGIALKDKDALEAVSNWYRTGGDDFDADYALSHGIVLNICGWVFSETSKDILAHSIRTEEFLDDLGEPYDMDIVPISVLREFADAYRAFADTEAGQRILACDELEVPYQVGNTDADEQDEYGNNVVYISPEKMVEAKRSLYSTGHGEAIERTLDEYWRIGVFADLGEIVDILENAGVTEVGWYESY